MQNKFKFDLNINALFKEEGITIIDYSNTDFRKYWEGLSKRILHICESEIIQSMLPSSGGRFFDLGCGHGRLLDSYYNKTKKITLIDYDIHHIEMARNNNSYKNITYIAADAYKLPFRDNVFNGGICIRLLHHINNPKLFLSELARICIPQARVVLSYLNKRSIFRILTYGRVSFKQDHAEVWNLLYGTHPKYLETSAKNAGFKILQTKGTGFLHQITHKFYNQLSHSFWDKNYFLKPFLLTEKLLDNTLGRLSLALMQFVLLKKKNDKNIMFNNSDRNKKLIDIIQCPECHSQKLVEKRNEIVCSECKRPYPVINSIINFL